jgi:hypothetical protein
MVELAFGTPRKLPKAEKLKGRVVVVDIAFAGTAGGGFDKITNKFIVALGERLVGWIDHHDHERHVDFKKDERFVLAKKSEHGACPEMVTPEVVRRVGPVDTVLCHTDFDGLASAAKWLCGGEEPYPGCDADARAIDTRLGTPSAEATKIDRALRGRPGDEQLMRDVVELFCSHLQADRLWDRVSQAADELIPIERETERAARSFKRYPSRLGGGAAYLDVTSGYGSLDKTDLLLRGQALERIAIVVDQHNVSVAAPFDSGLNFLEILALDGGMPTRVSVPRKRLHDVLDRLGIDFV